MTRSLKGAVVWVLCCSAMGVSAGECPQPPDPKVAQQPGLLPLSSNSVSPSAQRMLKLPIYLPEATERVILELRSADDILVRRLEATNLKQGVNHLSWDGLDEEGKRVPDAAYTPVLKVKASEHAAEQVDDPRVYSGGEIIRSLGRNWGWSGEHDIAMTLPAPARVMVRAIIDNGPVVKTIQHWEAKPDGRVVVRWDGFDEDQVEPVYKRSDLKVVVMGYCLPTFSFVTYGADAKNTYQSYRKRHGGDSTRPLDPAIQLSRNGKRLEKNYFMPRLPLPDLTLEFPTEQKRLSTGEYLIDAPTTLKGLIPDDQRWLIESSLYEISIFYDYEFVQEEEQGFIPFFWQIDPKRLSPGRHLVTIQVTAFNGIFVSRTVPVMIQKEDS